MLIDDMLAELEAALEPFVNQLEGFRDYFRMLEGDSEKAARLEVGQAVKRYELRRDLIAEALARLRALAADAYPTPPRFEFTPETVETMRANRETVLTAFGEIEPATAPGQAEAGLTAAVDRVDRLATQADEQIPD